MTKFKCKKDLYMLSGELAFKKDEIYEGDSLSGMTVFKESEFTKNAYPDATKKHIVYLKEWLNEFKEIKDGTNS